MEGIMQSKVSFFNVKYNGLANMDVYARCLDVISEMGELSKEVLKGSDYGNKTFVKSEYFEMEFGDVMYSLLSLANECQIDANKCLDMALDKYKKRLEKGSMGSEVEK